MNPTRFIGEITPNSIHGIIVGPSLQEVEDFARMFQSRMFQGSMVFGYGSPPPTMDSYGGGYSMIVSMRG